MGWYPLEAGWKAHPRAFSCSPFFFREPAGAHTPPGNLWLAPGGSVSRHLRRKRTSFFFSHRANPPWAAKSLLQRPKDQIKLCHKLRGINNVTTSMIRYEQCPSKNLMFPASTCSCLPLMPIQSKAGFLGQLSQADRTSLEWYLPVGDAASRGSFSDFMIIHLLSHCLDIGTQRVNRPFRTRLPSTLTAQSSTPSLCSYAAGVACSRHLVPWQQLSLAQSKPFLLKKAPTETPTTTTNHHRNSGFRMQLV